MRAGLLLRLAQQLLTFIEAAHACRRPKTPPPNPPALTDCSARVASDCPRPGSRIESPFHAQAHGRSAASAADPQPRRVGRDALRPPVQVAQPARRGSATRAPAAAKCSLPPPPRGQVRLTPPAAGRCGISVRGRCSCRVDPRAVSRSVPGRESAGCRRSGWAIAFQARGRRFDTCRAHKPAVTCGNVRCGRNAAGQPTTVWQHSPAPGRLVRPVRDFPARCGS